MTGKHKIIVQNNKLINLKFKSNNILFSLIKNVDIINLELDDGSTITYKKSELVDAYGDKYGKKLEKIIEFLNSVLSNEKILFKQMKKELLDIGLTKMKIEDTEVNIYDQERMLIELIRYKSKLPYELYKDVLNNYRKIKEKLNFIKLYKYAQNFNNLYIMRTIETEVM